VQDVKKQVVDALNAIDFMQVEYYEIVDALTMQPIQSWLPEGQSVGCITVYCGDVRLIDNIKY
jgi:pantoate--beta-alanine ligase